MIGVLGAITPKSENTVPRKDREGRKGNTEDSRIYLENQKRFQSAILSLTPLSHVTAYHQLHCAGI